MSDLFKTLGEALNPKDKIREEFEKYEYYLRAFSEDEENPLGDSRRYAFFQIKDSFYAGYNSRDEEIEELIKQKSIMRNIITARDKKIKKYQAIERDAVRMDKGIVILQTEILNKDAEIKKLREVLDEAVNKEREECALICEEKSNEALEAFCNQGDEYYNGSSDGSNECAEAIRQRGE